METYTDAELFRGCLGVLPQNPQALFVKKTLLLDLLEMTDSRLSKAEREREAARRRRRWSCPSGWTPTPTT